MLGIELSSSSRTEINSNTQYPAPHSSLEGCRVNGTDLPHNSNVIAVVTNPLGYEPVSEAEVAYPAKTVTNGNSTKKEPAVLSLITAKESSSSSYESAKFPFVKTMK